MVGTSAIRLPAARASSAQVRMAAGLSISSMRAGSGPRRIRAFMARFSARDVRLDILSPHPDPLPEGEGTLYGRVGVVYGCEGLEAVRLGGECGGADFAGVGADRFARGGPELGVAFGEAWRRAIAEAEDVVQHQDLAVAVHAGADADGRNAQARGELGGEVERHALEHDRERARCLDGGRIFDQPLRLARRPARPRAPP